VILDELFPELCFCFVTCQMKFHSCSGVKQAGPPLRGLRKAQHQNSLS
jgi:hypothetical protein